MTGSAWGRVSAGFRIPVLYQCLDIIAVGSFLALHCDQNGHLIEDILLNSGFFETCFFHHASTIEDAVEYFPGSYFHFIIIDPLVSLEFGLPLIKTIKDCSPSTKIIAFSLCSVKPCTTKCRQQCLECGADCCLDKVRHFNLLPETVKKCLSLAPPGFIRPHSSLNY